MQIMSTHQEITLEKDDVAQRILPYINELRADIASGKLVYKDSNQK